MQRWFSITSAARRVSEWALRRLIPEGCAACDAPLLSPDDLWCPDCQARTRPARSRADNSVPTIALFQYEEPVSTAIQRFKYENRPELGRRLGRALAAHAKQALSPALRDGACLVPVPLHPKRLSERGYNQSALLARAIHHGLGVPLQARALERLSHTARQATLKREQRLVNLREQFRARGSLTNRVILVDDVVTTGATLSACCHALEQSGATLVCALSLAAVS